MNKLTMSNLSSSLLSRDFASHNGCSLFTIRPFSAWSTNFYSSMGGLYTWHLSVYSVGRLYFGDMFARN